MVVRIIYLCFVELGKVRGVQVAGAGVGADGLDGSPWWQARRRIGSTARRLLHQRRSIHTTNINRNINK